MMTLVTTGLNMPSHNDDTKHSKHVAATHKSANLVFLVTCWVVDESPMQLLRLFAVKLLSAVWALECARHFDANVCSGTITRLGRITDFHCLRHGFQTRRSRCPC